MKNIIKVCFDDQIRATISIHFAIYNPSMIVHS